MTILQLLVAFSSSPELFSAITDDSIADRLISGINGLAIVKQLARDDGTWEKVYAMSRSKKYDFPASVEFSHIDLQASAKEMAEQIQGIEVTHVFFAAYLAKDDEGEAAKVNNAMLENFLGALEITGAEKTLQRIVMTTGAKQYGLHLGRVKTPMEESDPWVEGEGRPPNFYYDQQRTLARLSKEKNWDYVVTYPQDVIGLARGNFMNLSTSLGLYASICKALPGSKLQFPGSPDFYMAYNCWTSANLHAQFNAWAALEPKAAYQGFNVVNGDAESYQNLWPKIAKLFGCVIPEDQFSGPTPDSSEQVLDPKPPIADIDAQMGMKGAFSPSKVIQQVDLEKWSKKEEVEKTWALLAKKYDLEQDAFENATWSFLGFVLGRNYSMIISMSKARKCGWTGYKDTWDALKETFEELVEQKILPPFNK